MKPFVQRIGELWYYAAPRAEAKYAPVASAKTRRQAYARWRYVQDLADAQERADIAEAQKPTKAREVEFA